VSIPLNSIYILAQEQFGSTGLTEFKILYNCMDEVLYEDRHCLKDNAGAFIVTLSDF